MIDGGRERVRWRKKKRVRDGGRKSERWRKRESEIWRE